jgi:LacI family transcriptional regulator
VGRNLASRFLKGDYKATALIGVNDMTALGIMAELAASGCRMPQDYSVCGFDNIFSSNVTTPGLTTIDHHLRARCHAAAEMLINPTSLPRMMQGFEDMPLVNKIEYTPRLVIRESTGLCRKQE